MKFYTVLSLLLMTIFANTCDASCNNETPNCEQTIQHGPYVELIGGANFLSFRQNHAHLHPGYHVEGIMGYKFSTGLRLEAEASYERSKVRSAKGLHHVSGHTRTNAYMVNCLFDIDLDGPITPYFGSGVGYALTKGKWTGSQPSTSVAAETTSKRDGIAWQGIAGVKYLICQGLEAGVDYRYVLCGKYSRDHKVGLSLTQYF